MIRCVVFDLGDTLIRHGHLKESLISDVDVPFLRELGHDIAAGKLKDALVKARALAEDTYSRYEIVHNPTIVLRIAGESLGFLLPTDKIETWAEARHAYLRDRETLMPHARDVLEYVKKKGLMLAVVTNTSLSTAEARLKKFGLEGFFGEVISSDEAGLKENGTPFRLLMELCGLRSEECLMVGDDPVQDMAAASLGMQVVILHSPYKRYSEDMKFDKIQCLSELERFV